MKVMTCLLAALLLTPALCGRPGGGGSIGGVVAVTILVTYTDGVPAANATVKIARTNGVDPPEYADPVTTNEYGTVTVPLTTGYLYVLSGANANGTWTGWAFYNVEGPWDDEASLILDTYREP